jgi:putative transposase
VKVRESGRIVSVAVIVAVGINSDGRREVLGMDTGPSEAETFWTEFLHKLARRACAASSWSSPMPMKALRPLSLRRCMPPGGAAVHFMGNVLAHAGRQGRRVVAAFIGTAFVQDDAEAARTQWRQVPDQLRPKVPKVAALMDEAEADVLAFMTFPKDHRPKIHSINPFERLNGEIKRRTDVVGIFSNGDAITRLIGPLLLE